MPKHSTKQQDELQQYYAKTEFIFSTIINWMQTIRIKYSKNCQVTFNKKGDILIHCYSKCLFNNLYAITITV